MPKFVAKCSVAMIKKTNDGKMAKSVYKKNNLTYTIILTKPETSANLVWQSSHLIYGENCYNDEVLLQWVACFRGKNHT